MGTEAKTATTAQCYDTALSISDLTASANTERGRFDVIDRVALTLPRGQVTGLCGRDRLGQDRHRPLGDAAAGAEGAPRRGRLHLAGRPEPAASYASYARNAR